MQQSGTSLLKDNWLVGKTVLITGAASGIGRALALLLSKNGSIVVAHGRSQACLKALAASIRGNVIYVSL